MVDTADIIALAVNGRMRLPVVGAAFDGAGDDVVLGHQGGAGDRHGHPVIRVDAARNVKCGFGHAFTDKDAAGGDEVALHPGHVGTGCCMGIVGHGGGLLWVAGRSTG